MRASMFNVRVPLEEVGHDDETVEISDAIPPRIRGADPTGRRRSFRARPEQTPPSALSAAKHSG